MMVSQKRRRGRPPIPDRAQISARISKTESETLEHIARHLSVPGMMPSLSSAARVSAQFYLHAIDECENSSDVLVREEFVRQTSYRLSEYTQQCGFDVASQEFLSMLADDMQVQTQAPRYICPQGPVDDTFERQLTFSISASEFVTGGVPLRQSHIVQRAIMLYGSAIVKPAERCGGPEGYTRIMYRISTQLKNRLTTGEMHPYYVVCQSLAALDAVVQSQVKA